ncbi:MAG: efflux RND transporter periplasmic adaptor subunit [Acidobacteriota bacterium]|jgi:HlyD family secretion protein|nr:efflux RND transporter periplasmic adaptor subunit [Acidobacteriota bacterium]
MKKIMLYGLLALMVVVAAWALLSGSNGKEGEIKLVAVERGTIAEKALAVGTIEPENEVKVKSTISGIVSEIYFKIGDSVEKGKPLFKISPNPTPLEYAEARRNMEMARVTWNQAARERDRQLKLFEASLISRSDMEQSESAYQEARIRAQIARERFALLEKGKVRIAGHKDIDSVVKSPITGMILSQNVFVGDPVVPLTNFQPGTEMCAMADMGSILFKGTVDEIDVGKLSAGMAAEIQVGALPDVKVNGRLERISPKAHKDGNSTLFDIEIAVLASGEAVLRAGYSATANIKVREKTDVLILPERLVTFDNGNRTVEIKEGENIVTREVETGLSDSLNVEIVKGLTEKDQVVERPPREIQ